MPHPESAPAQRLRLLALCLGKAVTTRGLWGGLAGPLVVLILDRLRQIKDIFVDLAARIEAGTYQPRAAATRTPRDPAAEPKPRQKGPLPGGYAWLIRLVPEAAACGGQLQTPLEDPEMKALLAAAPVAMRRPIRSLCRALAVQPPPVLALPRVTRPKKPPKPRFRLPEWERGFSARYPAGRPRYIGDLRAPWPAEKLAQKSG